MRRWLVLILALLAPAPALAQGAVEQGGPWTQAHACTLEQIAELAPEIQGAYRRAAEAIGAPTVAPAQSAERYPTLAAMLQPKAARPHQRGRQRPQASRSRRMRRSPSRGGICRIDPAP